MAESLTDTLPQSQNLVRCVPKPKFSKHQIPQYRHGYFTGPCVIIIPMMMNKISNATLIPFRTRGSSQKILTPPTIKKTNNAIQYHCFQSNIIFPLSPLHDSDDYRHYHAYHPNNSNKFGETCICAACSPLLRCHIVQCGFDCRFQFLNDLDYLAFRDV